MIYKGFVISPQPVTTCTGRGNSYYKSGFTTAYQIIDAESGYVCCIKHSLASAQKAVDIHGHRWHVH